MLSLSAAILAWIGCIIALWQAFRTETTIHSTSNRVAAVEERLESLSGKVARAKRTDRDTIRSEVESLLDEYDVGGSGGMDSGMMQQLLMSQMLGGMPQGNPEEQPPVEDNQQPNLFGSGGNVNAQSETGNEGT